MGLRKEFNQALIFDVDECYYSIGCAIKQAKNTTSLRKFIIERNNCSCKINLVQKDKKYYRNNGYDYVWARMIIAMKENDGHDYRWINGQYSKGKIISLNCMLNPG
eukprot:GHVR01168255.1.p1 GENE.GHVR01168255.1~~GHVR01168255.1.p1  ORF type:complete len:106 (-),score=10.41 GHVR01168255.1:144-461(-)